MAEITTLKDLKDLRVLLETNELAPDPVEAPSAPDRVVDIPPTAEAAPPDLGELLAELEGARAALGGVARRDDETRAAGLRDLADYDALAAGQAEAEGALERARQLRSEAEAVAEAAFADEAHAAAERIAGQARQAEAATARLVDERRAAAERFAAGHDLERALAGRRRAEAAEKARAAVAEKARRLAGIRTGVSEALQAGRLEEARDLLAPAINENPGDPELVSLTAMMAQRELTVKIDLAERALWFARRSHRCCPQDAIDRLTALDVAGLPEPCARQLFGAWAQACARLCRERGVDGALRYAPDAGRGAVLAPTADGGYEVVSALGMGPAWGPGTRVGEHQVRRARPLR
jgi:hypothetical protein